MSATRTRLYEATIVLPSGGTTTRRLRATDDDAALASASCEVSGSMQRAGFGVRGVKRVRGGGIGWRYA